MCRPTEFTIIDELLIDYMRAKGLQPADMERHSIATASAMEVLRDGYENGNRPITLTWANYFDSQKEAV